MSDTNLATPYILAIDQGTTSSRAMVFDRFGACHHMGQIASQSSYPHSGWVEQDADKIIADCLSLTRDAITKSSHPIAAIGITNQRETCLIWDRQTGKALTPAIVWQDRRTSDLCAKMAADNIGPEVESRTGLRLDPYFSASKLAWLLSENPGLRQRAEAGELAFGTIDSYLIWHLTAGKIHATDTTNASRTLLVNLETGQWDPDMLSLFQIPESLLPEIKPCNGDFGITDANLLGISLPIRGVAGDQHAALFGQTCFKPGMIKSTYGTGCFMLMNIGTKPILSKNRLLSTLSYDLSGQKHYALEGSIFVAGAALQWLRDVLGILPDVKESAEIAASLEDTEGVYFVPAFAGLGAPDWIPTARGIITGLSQGTGRAHIIRAALEAQAYQTRDLIGAMEADIAESQTEIDFEKSRLRVDGGLVANDWAMQYLSTQLNRPVERPSQTETTALGAAFLAGLGAGLYQDCDEIANLWQCETQFLPESNALDSRNAAYKGWQTAISQVKTGA